MKGLVYKTIATVLILTMLFGLSGCHGSRGLPEFAVPEQFDDSRTYSITFWAKNDTNKTQTNIYEKAIRDFEELYPNIEITLKLYTDYGRIYNDVITNISTNTTPNVCITYPDHIATYLTGNNTVVPLNELMNDGKYGLGGTELRFDGPDNGEIVPKFLGECSFNGTYYAIPYMRSTEACYINKTFVNALGYEIPDVLTWDFIWEVSEAAMETDENGIFKINGQNVLIPFIYKSTDNMMIQMLKQLKSGYSQADGSIEIFNSDTKSILLEISKHARSRAFSTFKISSYPANFLNAGQCIFAIDSTAGSTWMGSDAPLSDISEEAKVQFETVVTTIPQFNEDDPVMISQGPSICVFNKKDSQEVLASWLFAQFLLTNSVQIAYAETEGYIPVTSKAMETDEYADYLNRTGEDNTVHYPIKIEATKLLISNIDNTFTTPVFNGSASLRDAAGQMIEMVTKAERRKQPVDEAYVEKVFDDVQSLYHLNQGSIGNNAESGRKELGELPAESRILLITLVGIWFILGAYLFIENKKGRRKAQNP